MLNPTPLSQIAPANFARIKTGYLELDEVLGGGLVRKSTTLLAGMAGAGKSTLLLQIAEQMSYNGMKILYISGEEQPGFIKQRAERVGVEADNLSIISQDDIWVVQQVWRDFEPDVVFVDSLQTLYDSKKKNPRGKAVQNATVLKHIKDLANITNSAVIIIGQVTKTGTIQGGNDIAHDVDVVMRFDYWKQTRNRSIYAEKNRFGSIDNEWDVEMTPKGVFSKNTHIDTSEHSPRVYLYSWGFFFLCVLASIPFLLA